MSFHHYTADEIAALRAHWPQHFLVELATAGAACVLVIADTPANRERVFSPTLMPDMTADMLDGNTIVSGGPR